MYFMLVIYLSCRIDIMVALVDPEQDPAIARSPFQEIEQQQGHSASYPAGNGNQVESLQPTQPFCPQFRQSIPSDDLFSALYPIERALLSKQKNSFLCNSTIEQLDCTGISFFKSLVAARFG